MAPKVSRAQHQAAMRWALACAEHVLSLCAGSHPDERRPAEALAVARAWLRTGVFRMAEIRRASLGAHAAARSLPAGGPAQLAARACGQAVATAHVWTHALGAAFYGVKAAAAAGRTGERAWQTRRLVGTLRRLVEVELRRRPVLARFVGPRRVQRSPSATVQRRGSARPPRRSR